MIAIQCEHSRTTRRGVLSNDTAGMQCVDRAAVNESGTPSRFFLSHNGSLLTHLRRVRTCGRANLLSFSIPVRTQILGDQELGTRGDWPCENLFISV